MTATNTTCKYSSKQDAPAGKLCGNLVCNRGKFLGQIRKTGDNEFTVYGWEGIVGVFQNSDFRRAGINRITASKSLIQYALK
jgi:hypothetical protein